jgi:serine/threonine protein kinase
LFEGYVFSVLRKGDLSLYRGSGDSLDPILVVVPVGKYSARESPKRLEHEYAPRAVDADWAARPVALALRAGRMTLVLEDPGGEPLDSLLGRPMALTLFLPLAVGLSAAIGRLHKQGLIHKDIKPPNMLVNRTTDNVADRSE